MEKNNQDVFTRAYATLKSLRKYINEMNYGVLETYVHEFHNVLDKLEGIGIDVSEFRIPTSEVKPQITSVSRAGRHYSEEKYVGKSYILIKIDTILGYFEIVTSEKPRRMGFNK